ncbi:MAG: DmsC/YnfH family molybdoenzyme membrane anchor subunit [Myxococcota bacterium]|nr:DmsC/YnfH family molybdoenzyme membrane anchor subunit [Myxococcota bacterium]
MTSIGDQMSDYSKSDNSELTKTWDSKKKSWSSRLPIIDSYLKEQQDLTAVERFAQLHEHESTVLQGKYYQDLLPTNLPGESEQYAFEVDLDNCTGCKACVTGCTSLNGLKDGETWRDVGLVIGGTGSQATTQHVTTACHHCLEPACAKGCPVNAYVKDEETGIVKHLDDQCIGCQYCTLTCPYDVPKFSKSMGIVRKCDMCIDRLKEGEAPACVQACPTGAINISVVNKRDVLRKGETGMLIPGTPPSNITYPTTTYKSKSASIRHTLPADYYRPQQQHSHWPLIFLLVLSQMSIGVFAIQRNFLLESLAFGFHSLVSLSSLLGLAIMGLALTTSLFHLGRPQYAFRAILGIGHSWLSREILTFGIYFKVALIFTAACLVESVPELRNKLPTWYPDGLYLLPILSSMTLIAGGTALLSSVMVYHDTKRIFWNWLRGGFKFVSTTLLLGITSLLLLSSAYLWNSETPPTFIRDFLNNSLIPYSALLMGAKLSHEISLFHYLRDSHNSAMKRTAQLHFTELLNSTVARVACGLLGGILIPLLLMHDLRSSPAPTGPMVLIMGFGSILVFCGEVLERYHFFSAVVVWKMPGDFR